LILMWASSLAGVILILSVRRRNKNLSLSI
jgi:hypothetical protein